MCLTMSQNLTTLDLSNFDTKQVTNMSSMFAGSAYLQEINLNGFITKKKLTDMSSMFASCSGLKRIDLNSFDTSQVTDMTGMFNGASSLQELDISNFDTSSVNYMTVMFAGAKNLQTIIFGPKFIHKSGATTSSMFSGCPSSDRPIDSSWQGVSFN